MCGDSVSRNKELPLYGKVVLVTRTRNQASALTERITQLGGQAIELPVIETRPPSDENARRKLDEALGRIAEFDWIVFTSVNGVGAFFERMLQLFTDVDLSQLIHARIAAVGPITAQALTDRGLQVEELPAQYQAEGLLELLGSKVRPGQKVLLPRANLGRSVLPEQLAAWGLEVTDVDAYETAVVSDGADEVLTMFRNGDIDIVTFTSSSTVRNLLVVLRDLGGGDPAPLLQNVEIACIGPLTAQTATECGLNVTYIAAESTVPSLVEAMVQHAR